MYLSVFRIKPCLDIVSCLLSSCHWCRLVTLEDFASLGRSFAGGVLWLALIEVSFAASRRRRCTEQRLTLGLVFSLAARRFDQKRSVVIQRDLSQGSVVDGNGNAVLLGE